MWNCPPGRASKGLPWGRLVSTRPGPQLSVLLLPLCPWLLELHLGCSMAVRALVGLLRSAVMCSLWMP